MRNGCESGAGCLRAASGPIGVSRKRTFREVSRAGKTLSLCRKGRMCGCHTAVQPVPSVGAVTQSTVCTGMLRILHFFESSGSLLLSRVLTTMPCIPRRFSAFCVSRVVMLAMQFLFWYHSRHALSFIVSTFCLLSCSPPSRHAFVFRIQACLSLPL